MNVTTFSDPVREMDKLQTSTTAWSRRAEAGQDAIPFHKFADLIKTQVASLKEKGSAEVAFRVAVKDGKVTLDGAGVEGDVRE